jgi:hypothetical protein
VWGICSPTYANISRRNLKYPGACSGDSLFKTAPSKLDLVEIYAAGKFLFCPADLSSQKKAEMAVKSGILWRFCGIY